jgi:hypothetical protein
MCAENTGLPGITMDVKQSGKTAENNKNQYMKHKSLRISQSTLISLPHDFLDIDNCILQSKYIS